MFTGRKMPYGASFLALPMIPKQFTTICSGKVETIYEFRIVGINLVYNYVTIMGGLNTTIEIK